MKYTLKELSIKHNVSKTSIQRYIQQLDPDKLHQTVTTASNNRSMILIDDELAKMIDELISGRTPPQDDPPTVDTDATDSHSSNTAEPYQHALTAMLQTVDTLQRQLESKDREIDRLHTQAEAQQRTINDLIGMLSTRQQETPQERTQSLISRIFRRRGTT